MLVSPTDFHRRKFGVEAEAIEQKKAEQEPSLDRQQAMPTNQPASELDAEAASEAEIERLFRGLARVKWPVDLSE